MIRLLSVRNGLILLTWAGMLFGALSIADIPGDWGHSICGPWGCGPPTQALVGCHLAWLVVLVPPIAMLARSTHVPVHIRRRIGTYLCVAAATFLATVVIYQRVAWWPSANEWQQGFFWQRCGFVLATMIDLPAAQVLLLGIWLRNQRLQTNVIQLTEPTPLGG